MYLSPADEWRALTEHYREMVDEELLELSAEFDDLTPTAQHVLRDEMRLRNLGDPQTPRIAKQSPQVSSQFSAPRDSPRNPFSFSLGARPPELVSHEPTAESPPAGAVEYTWKTPLCVCSGDEQAWQISELLRRAGIESWIEGPRTYASSSASEDTSIDNGNRRVLVAADQLDEARALAAQPIPPDIIEESRVQPEEYELPACPECGVADPVLENVEPVNMWKCEVCGAEWTDCAAETDQAPAKSSQSN